VFDERPIRSIRPVELRKVVKGIAAAGKPAQAQHVLRVIKSLFSWAAQEEVLGEDEAVSPVALVKVKKHRGAPGYVPTPEELGRLFWRLDTTPMLPGTRFAVALVALTAQRRETVAAARVADFRPMAGRDGWGLWVMEPDPLIEHDRLHVLPLPPMAWQIVRVARMCAAGSEYLFPQTRLRNKDDAGGGHMSMKALAEALQEAAGDHISPHDMRRALATHGPEVLGIRDADTKLVLNHATGRQDVTGRHYAFHQSMPWKAAVLERWEGWLVQLTRQAAPRPGAWPGFLPEVEATAAPPLLLAG
jgi:integrase